MDFQYVHGCSGFGGGGYTYVDTNGFTNGGFGSHVSDYSNG